RVLRIADRSDDAEALRSRRGNLVRVIGVDPTNREPRSRGDLGRLADQLEPGPRTPLLGWRLPDRADADVVDRLLSGRLDLLPAVGGEPDDRVGAHDSPRLRWIHVVLADVNPVGAKLVREVGIVIDDEERSVCVGEPAKGLS